MTGSTVGRRLTDAAAFLFDVDGCLLLSARGGGGVAKAFAGANDVLREVRRSGKTLVTCTNGTYHPPNEYAAWLRSVGLDVRDEEMLTPAVVAAEHLVKAHDEPTAFVIADGGLAGPLEDRGVRVLDLAEAPTAKAVILGGVSGVTTPQIQAACDAVLGGAELLVTAHARWFASSRGKQIGTSGAYGAAITYITGVTPTTIGKPSPLVMELAAERTGVAAEDFVVVGDDIESEVGMGRAAGAQTVLLLSGVTSAEQVEQAAEHELPDLVLPDIGALRAHLGIS
jgi:HAD superfamily hydrolase (TIGR01450 family)